MRICTKTDLGVYKERNTGRQSKSNRSEGTHRATFESQHERDRSESIMQERHNLVEDRESKEYFISIAICRAVVAVAVIAK
jgi:hypothetical protein